MNFFNELVDQSLSRTRESTLSVLSLTDRGLREHLSEQFQDELGADGCFLAPPVFEHTFGWEASDKTLGDLEGTVLCRELLAVLEKAPAYQFSRDLQPYAHQLRAWEALSQPQPQSAVITSGTGSGKTECFMLPILDDLIREAESTNTSLIGVRALFLYPLNALINSQQERLDAWTQSYDDRVRFCLYNGMTEESASRVRKEQRLKPNQIMSRELLRSEPAPILMTNSTMLEYMLVRQVDRPILDISREYQSLRWIVLDEAHTYIGSNAAEMSLLLRRVVQAFGKRASEIRFVATSATISGEDSQARLARYLADLAGVSIEQISVIGGNRVWPTMEQPVTPTSLSVEEIATIDSGTDISEKRHAALATALVPMTLRDAIVTNRFPLNLNELVDSVSSHLSTIKKADQQREVLEWINLMTGTWPNDTEQPFLKVRCHLFQRMLHGLWACVDPACSAKTEHLISWPFGAVYVDQRTRCDCGAPVYELSFCRDCSSPHLLAEDRAGELCQLSPYAGDEFSLIYDNPEEDEEAIEGREIVAQGQKLIIAPSRTESEPYFEQNVNIKTSQFGALASADTIQVVAASTEGACCANCKMNKPSFAEFYRRAHLGAPFYVANAVPTVLEFCPDPTKDSTDNKSPEELPGRGRKLITFTDSRQGTARMAVRMQQEAERSRLRGLVFEALRNEQSVSDQKPVDIPTVSAEELLQQAQKMEQMGMSAIAEDLRSQAKQLDSGQKVTSPVIELDWESVVENIGSTFDISQSILDYNRYANPALFGGSQSSKTMARMLLAREFSRRPKTQNSLETLGLIKVGYQGIDTISKTPPLWAESRALPSGRGNQDDGGCLTLDDWKHFLTVALDFHVRENTILRLDRDMQLWMGGRFVPKVLFPPQSDIQESSTQKRWPYLRKSVASRLPKLLQLASIADLSNTADRDKINGWLESAWQALVKASILEPAENGHRLNLRTLTFSLPTSSWVCPVTQKLIPTTFRSLTPYLPRTLHKVDYRCEHRALPPLASLKPDGGVESKIRQIRKLVASDSVIASLRAENLWTDLSDRTVEGGFYYRTAEHSAQQSSKKLEHYEELFKKGKINVLNCSTTMEMGVDIGGISAVVMNNLPPHPANYLQRSGRAGRRNESRSISYTLCKADPHNQRAFRQPQWPFKTAIPAPHITLSSDRIVQRHVNSFLLSTHLCSLTTDDGDRTKLSVQWFFAGEHSPCHQFIDWLRTGADDMRPALDELVRGTALESMPLSDIFLRCIETMSDIEQRWTLEHQQIESKLEHASDEAYKKALHLELKRHESEYLLRDLSAKTFLPGHGFPTDVVSLNTYNIEDFIQASNVKYDESREDNIFNLKEQPTRELSVAIREYAPGAQVVIDGRVFICAGVSLQWQPSGFGNEAQKFDIAWRCHKCGSTGLVGNAYANSDDVSCHQCQEPISLAHQRTILKPKGFLTDFYDPTSNDITSQKFIRIEKPRVQLASSEILSLPTPDCGHVSYGHQGSVFYHSSGDNEKGYAVCLTCGKAVSMTKTGEIPANTGMLPDEGHRPVGGLMGSHKARDCSGSAVKKDLYLGYQVQTDVIEVFLRNPITGQWLSDSEHDRIIANTLAVAIRDVIADRLGIVSTEMGFSTRPDKDIETGAGRSVIQLYDQVSGGAGFVLSELSSIVAIIETVADKLICPRQCENVCSHCLASQDSRVEREPLDRHKAREWLTEAKYLEHLIVPDTLSSIPGAQYNSLGALQSLERALRKYNNSGATTLMFALNNDPAEWDLDDAQFRSRILNWILTNQYDVWLGVPNLSTLAEDLQRSLAILVSMGVKLFIADAAWNNPNGLAHCVVQVKIGDYCQTLFSTGQQSSTPGRHWLRAEPRETWVSSEEVACSSPLAVEISSVDATRSGDSLVEITGEFDGRVDDLHSRIRAHLAIHTPQLISILNEESPVAIRYSDRYLKSPWTALILGEFFKVFSSPALKEISIETMAPSKHGQYRVSTNIDHDWAIARVQKEVLSQWIVDSTGVTPRINLHTHTGKIQHGRTMTLEFPSGKECRLFLDQGMGYWAPRATHRDHLAFNFGTKVEHQPAKMAKFKKTAICQARNKWPTYLAVRVDESIRTRS